MADENIFDNTIDDAISNTNASVESPESLTWKKHGVYLLRIKVVEFFCGPTIKSPKPKVSQFKFIAEQVISTLTDKTDDSVIETSKELLAQHRTIEDTEARRRLERWACRIIIWYLFFVLLLILLNGVSMVIWSDVFKEGGFISDTVMYAILTSTTVNIIGLGLIVLKGHFPQKKSDKEKHSE